MLLALDFKPPIHPPLVGVLDPTLTCNLVSQTYSYLLKSCNCAAVRLESLMRSSRAVQVCACRAEAISMLLHCKVLF